MVAKRGKPGTALVYKPAFSDQTYTALGPDFDLIVPYFSNLKDERLA